MSELHGLEIQRLNQLYALLSEVNHALVTAQSREEFFQQVCEATVAKAGFLFAWIGKNNPITHRIDCVAVAGESKNYLDEIEIYSDDRPEGRGPTGIAVREGKPYICNNFFDNPFTTPWHGAARNAGFQASAAFPIFASEGLFGALTVYATDLEVFQPADIALLQEIATDIGFGIHYLEESDKQKKAVEEADRAKSAFLAGMSHELRTPLSAILGYTQILKRDGQLSRLQNKGIRAIHQAGEHLLQMINEILDFTKLEAQQVELELQSINLLEFLETVSEQAHVKAQQKKVQFECKFAHSLPQTLFVDQSRLHQVLLNILNNSIKFTPSGKVIFRVKEVEHAIRFEVEDSANEILPAQIDKIFEPFYRVCETDQHIDGTGLGLAISKRLVSKMGSTLFVQSIPEKGGLFWFDLPLTSNDSDSILAIPDDPLKPPRNLQGGHRKILIADDNLDCQDVLRELLAQSDFVIETAADGLEAIKTAAAFLPDLIFMDIRMPGITGIDAVQKIRHLPALSKTKIIGLSASADESTRRLCFAVGFDDFITKPFAFDSIFNLINRHLKTIDEESASSNTVTTLPLSTIDSLSDYQKIALPPEDLAQLHEAAQNGNVTALMNWIEIRQHDRPELELFISKIRLYLDRYQFDSIVELVDSISGRSRA